MKVFRNCTRDDYVGEQKLSTLIDPTLDNNICSFEIDGPNIFNTDDLLKQDVNPTNAICSKIIEQEDFVRSPRDDNIDVSRKPNELDLKKIDKKTNSSDTSNRSSILDV